MLIEFRVKNFRSFKEEQVFSMVAGNDKTLSDNCFESGGFKLLKSSALYGHNASGKSNLLKGLFALRKVVMTSTDIKDNCLDKYMMSFQFDNSYKNKPSFFEITFLLEGIRYQYGFTADHTRIFDEWLYSYPHKRAQKWFERKFDKENNKSNWSLNKTYLKGGEESLNQLKEKTRDDSLFLSVGFQWNNTQLSHVYEFFKDYLKIHIYKMDFLGETASYLLETNNNNNDKEFKKLKNLIVSGMKIADLGIEGINVEESKVSIPPEFLEQLRDESKSKLLESMKEEFSLKITFMHKVEGHDSLLPLPISEESLGTQGYFELLGPWFEALANGYTMFIDELESSLHPLLLGRLIDLWNDKKTNTKGAQIIFTSHESTLLNSELLRRDQVWFTEKGLDGATKLYSLLEYKPRKGEALQKGYLSGRYGAIPILEDFELNDN